MAANEMIADGCLEFLGGQDASKTPGLIAANAYAAGINVSTQKATLRPRWGYNLLKLEFEEEYYTLPNMLTRSYEDIFYSGKFQALAPYSTGGADYWIVVVSGIIYLINQKTLYAKVVHISDGSVINEMASRVNWSNAGRYFVIFDFPAFPVIIENGQARRADPALMQIPISTMGTYNQNRLFIANGGNEFTAGDPWGSLDPAQIEAPISFADVMTVGSAYYGQVFQLPTSFGNEPITAMGFLQATDTSTGIGPLIVATRKAIYTFPTQTPRADWEAGQFGTALIHSTGIAGPRALCAVNSDIFFIGADGQVRTLAMTRSEQSSWTQEPISGEVENWLKYQDIELAKYATIAYSRNKIFVTANPYRVTAYTKNRKPVVDYAHGGLVVLETDNISTLGATSSSVWAGLWTGLRPMDIVVDNERMIVMSKDLQSANNLWELDPETTYDRIGDKIRPVRSRIYTRAHDFKDPFTNKSTHSVEVILEGIKGDFTLDVKYKPTHGSYYRDWSTFKHSSPWRTCSVPKDGQLMGFEGQQIRDLNLGAPEAQDCNPVSNEYYSVFKRVQLMLTMCGIYWELHAYRIKAIELARNETESICTAFPIVETLIECRDDWATEELNLCCKPLT